MDDEIILRQISQFYAEELFLLVAKSRENDLCYWCPDLKRTYATLESTTRHIDDATSKFGDDQTPDLLIFFKGSCAGLISLSPIDVNQNSSEVGYWLGGEFERKGLISRSMPFVLGYAKDILRLKAVELSTSVPNLRSQRLPTKFGFHKLKVIPNAEILGDTAVDHVLWRHEF